VKRLLLDQGVPRSTGAILTRSGWEVTHVSEIGMSRASDADILERAKTEQRVCITLDADFHALLALGAEAGPSVVRVRKEGLDAGALAALLETVWPHIEEALDAGAMVTVTERSVRIRRLPIGRGRGKRSEGAA
jgi:predicted nuclease of predicted toxin-antitoxin system